MPPQFMIDWTRLFFEVGYTLIIIIFCQMVFFKTRDLFKLSKHKGIQYFRNAFMLFSLAYVVRLLVFLYIVSNSGIMRRMNNVMPLFTMLTAFFSTLAILYLVYSTIWKRFQSEHYLTVANSFALVISVLGFIYRSPFIVGLVQISLLGFLLLMTFKKKNTHKITMTKMLYVLLFIFWLINFVLLEPGRFLTWEIRLLLQIMSVVVFYLIYRKVSKWTK